MLDPGDKVLITSPDFNNYAQMVMLSGGETVPVSVYEKDDFVLTPEAVEAAVNPLDLFFALKTHGVEGLSGRNNPKTSIPFLGTSLPPWCPAGRRGWRQK